MVDLPSSKALLLASPGAPSTKLILINSVAYNFHKTSQNLHKMTALVPPLIVGHGSTAHKMRLKHARNTQ